MHGQTEIALIFLITILLIVWIVIERVKLREMASSHDKSKLPVLAIFIVVLNSIVFSLLSVIILDSIRLARVIVGIFYHPAIIGSRAMSCFIMFYCIGGYRVV